MKFKWFAILSCVVLLMLALTCAAYADGTNTDDYTIAANDATVTCTVTENHVDSFRVSYSGSDLVKGNQYVLLMVKLDGVEDMSELEAANLQDQSYIVKESNIMYIEQAEAQEVGNGVVSVDFGTFIPLGMPDSLMVLGGEFAGEAGPRILGAVIGQGVTISGEIWSYSPRHITTLYLFKKDGAYPTYVKNTEDGRVIDDTEAVASIVIGGPGEDEVSGIVAKQSFTFEDVENGVYRLVIQKDGYTFYLINDIDIDGSKDIDLTDEAYADDVREIVLIAGDLDASGLIDSADINVIYGEQWNASDRGPADLDNSGLVDSADINVIYGENWNKGDHVASASLKA